MVQSAGLSHSDHAQSRKAYHPKTPAHLRCFQKKDLPSRH